MHCGERLLWRAAGPSGVDPGTCLRGLCDTRQSGGRFARQWLHQGRNRRRHVQPVDPGGPGGPGGFGPRGRRRRPKGAVRDAILSLLADGQARINATVSNAASTAAGAMFGAKGGSGGGTVVGVGTPEDLAANPASHSGRYLEPLLAQR